MLDQKRIYDILIVTIPPLPGEDDDPGDERSVLESWEQEGARSDICQHGHYFEDCPRCFPYEA